MNLTSEAALPEFGERGAFRKTIGETGRAHLDRWLPFIVLHRGEGDSGSLARRVAINSPSYIVWSPQDDAAAEDLSSRMRQEIARQWGKPPLLIHLSDQPPPAQSGKAPRLPPFIARFRASGDADTARAARRLEQAMGEIRADLRRCKVEIFESESADPEPSIELELPSIHLRGPGVTYPQLEHELGVAFGDALLQAACAYLDDGSRPAPAHYRALGRSAFLAAAKAADRKLARVANSFDFLLSVSPINTQDALQQFLEGKGRTLPHFRYRPLAVDPDRAKKALYEIDLSVLEDPLLERLLSEKRREIDQQLTMLATRNTPAFRPASMTLYGAVEAELLEDALALLRSNERDPPGCETLSPDAVADAARSLIARYRAEDPRFDARVEIRADVSGLLVSGDTLLVGSDARVPRHRLEALLAHEVSVHLLTYFNGAAQGLGIFRTGLANYEGVQEGLGVFAEWAVGGLTRTRLRLLAGRVVAVDAMLRGTGFVAAWEMLVEQHGFRPRAAFGIAARTFRSGGFAKDAIYLRGFRQVVDMVATGASLTPFWLGKIAPGHAAAIEELLLRGLVHPPPFLPEFLERRDIRERIGRLRGGLEFQAMFEPEMP